MIDLSNTVSAYVVGLIVGGCFGALVRSFGGQLASMVCAVAAASFGVSLFHPALTAGWSIVVALGAILSAIAAIGLLSHDRRRRGDDEKSPPASGS